MQYANETTQSIGHLEAVFCMLWVFGLMAAVLVSVVGKKIDRKTRKRIGGEIELMLKDKRAADCHHSFANYLRLQELEAKPAQYMSANCEQTKIQPDSSVGSYGMEIVSPPMDDENHVTWFNKVFKAMRGMTKPSIDAGFHVHVGLRHYQSDWGMGDTMTWRDARAISGRTAYAYGWFEQVIDSLVSRSRRDGSGMSVDMGSMNYIVSEFRDGINNPSIQSNWNEETNEYEYKIKHDHELESIRMYDLSVNERYQKLNTQSLRKHGTIEFRQHQCISSNAKKATMWADLCYEFVNRCADAASISIIRKFEQSFDGMMNFMALTESEPLYKYWNQRRQLLAGESLPNACSSCGSHQCMDDYLCDKNTRNESFDWAEWESNLAYKLSEIKIICPSEMCGLWNTTETWYSVNDYGNPVDMKFQDIQLNDGNLEWADSFCPTCGCEDSPQYAMSTLLLGLFFILPKLAMVLLIAGCGIGAIHGAGRKFNAKNKFKTLWRKLADRGGQAAGFAYEAGTGVRYVKAPHSSVALSHNMNRYISKDTQWGMCHTRFATHGINNDENAHPHFDKDKLITMVHNGVVNNHDEVWTGLGMEPTGDVDSMAVAQCLATGIETVVKHCKGSMSLIWSDAREAAGTLKCWTNGLNPLHMGRLDNKDTGAIVIASTEKHLTDSFGSRLVVDWKAYVGREYTIHPDGTISKRDIKGTEDTEPRYVYDWRQGYSGGWSTQAPTSKTPTPTTQSTPQDKTMLEKARRYVLRNMDGFGGWRPTVIDGIEFHGFDGLSQEGVTVKQYRYRLPSWLNPMQYQEDEDSILLGEYYSESTDVEMTCEPNFDDYWNTGF
tara:strand:- start:1122 stop:3626 length:2505 start_codon:yes stop_codon:yes gene_type:complete